jgi:pyruvate,orthophosphate dikinase
MMAGGQDRMIKFGAGYRTEASVDEFGKKGAVLAEMSSMGIPIPPGFVLNISVCEDYFKNGRQLPTDVPQLLKNGIAFLEKATGLIFGSERKPLLLSVRSGSSISMPGAMETVLNVGIGHDAVKGLILQTGNPRFAWDSYRRLIEGFGRSVFSHDPVNYYSRLEEMIEHAGISEESDLDYVSLKELAGRYESVFQNLSGRRFPQDSYEQLELAVTAVLESWMGPKAKEYRRMEGNVKARGTAVTVQSMVFGNRGMHSGSGVAFTRNPWSGENEFLIDFRFGVQGEDVVSGYRAGTSGMDMIEVLPEVYKDLAKYAKLLEGHYRNMQDIEFTVQEGKLYILQSRDGKRTPFAALRIAVDMYDEGLIDVGNALKQLEGIDPEDVTTQEIVSDARPLSIGDSASSGITSGMMSFSSEKAESLSNENKVILVKDIPSPDDIKGIKASTGYLTSRGARTSHAAVVARQMGKVCIVNCTGLHIDLDSGTCSIGEKEFLEGDIISIDGSSGHVYEGEVRTRTQKPLKLLSRVREWHKKQDTTLWES